jgi:hypothetical protein
VSLQAPLERARIVSSKQDLVADRRQHTIRAQTASVFAFFACRTPDIQKSAFGQPTNSRLFQIGDFPNQSTPRALPCVNLASAYR